MPQEITKEIYGRRFRLPLCARRTLGLGLLLAASFAGAQPSFSPVPGALTQLSVGADGTVWGINSSQQIYSYDYVSGNWTNIPGSLVQIAVGSSTAIWGVNVQQQIFRWDPVNSDWINILGSLTQVAVGADGDVWGVNYQSNIYHYNPQTQLFSPVPGTLTQIAVGSTAAVYGLNDEGALFWYNPGSSRFEYINGTVGFGTISVGVDGDVWAVNSGVAYHYNALQATMEATPGSFATVAVGYGAAVYGLDNSGNIFEWNAVSQNWVQIPGSLSSIAAGGNGVVWGIDSSQGIFLLAGGPTRPFQFLSTIPGSLNQISIGVDGNVWALNGTTVEYFNRGTQMFEAVSGAPPLMQLSVGAGANVWGVDSSGNIFQYNATTATWNNIPGQLTSISVGADGSVWGINASGQTYTYNSATASWTNIPGQLNTLSVGADGTVWGINAGQQIYRFDAGTQSWVNVPGLLVQISVGNASNIWGVNYQHQVYRLDTSTQTWAQIPFAALVDIAAAFDGTVWGVNETGGLYQWNPATQTFNFAGSGITNAVAGNAEAEWALNTSSGTIYSWFGGKQGQPVVTLNTPAAGANQLSGQAYNVDPSTTAVVIYALTNQWYVQPLADAPFTTISPDGSWTSSTYPWNSLVVLLVNPSTYTAAATEITNPALDPGVLAWTIYPPGPVSVDFSGYTWGIKVTGNSQTDQFDPGPNFWSNDPSVVNVAADGLYLNITEINGMWQCGEVYLTRSLGYGTYTVQVGSPLDQLDQNTVAAPLFIYAGTNEELDNEYSGSGGLIAVPNNAQFVVQPYTTPGNVAQYVQPSTNQFTTQMQWSANQVIFTSWSGWSSVPAPDDIIYQWTYTGSDIPPAGQERVHISLWLYKGNPPVSGVGDQMVIHSFAFQPASEPQ